MNVQEIARARTLEVRDALAHLDSRIADLVHQKQAAEERVRSVAAEINKWRDSEGEAKRQITEADEKVVEVQRKLDEIEQQRSMLIDELMRLRSTRQQIEDQTRQAKEGGQKMDAEFRMARDQATHVEEDLRRLEDDKARHTTVLRRTLFQAFGEYQTELFRSIQGAILGEEARRQRALEMEALRRARHEDPQIGDLCDQRDQYKELLSRATVPGVRQGVEGLLQTVETQLQRVYPMALSVDDQLPSQDLLAEVCFFRDADGAIVISLPIDETSWRQLRDGSTDTSAKAAAAVIWAVGKGLGLKPADTDLALDRGYCAYRAQLGEEEMTLLAATTVNLPESRSLQLRFSRLPGDIEEAIRDEAAN